MVHFSSLLSLLPLLTLTSAIPLGGKPSPNNKSPHNPHSKPNKRTAQEVIQQLSLIPNPEGGYFSETFRDDLLVSASSANNVLSTGTTPRSASTAIYYLLEGSVGFSLWHHIDAVEVWHYYAGAPLTLSLWREGETVNGKPAVRNVTLGPDVFAQDTQPQVVIAAWEWQRARSLGEWTLVGTTGEFY